MKKKVIAAIICGVALVGSVYWANTTNADLNNTGRFAALQSQSDENPSSDKIAVRGNDIKISEAEVNESEKFYMANGESEQTAKKDALNNLKEYYALYAEAQKKGYSVTEDEVDNYLDELKKQMSEAANKDDVQAVISAYGNEDDYWKYMKKVYMKRLVVMKYTKDLEKDFASEYKQKNGDSDMNRPGNLNLIR